MFVRLFALTQREAEAMPHTIKRRPLEVYYLHGVEAVERVLADGGLISGGSGSQTAPPRAGGAR